MVCPLMCCFCLKLLYVYEIGITAIFEVRICNYTALFVIAKFTEKRTHVRGLSMDRQLSAQLVAVGPKQREQLRTLNASQVTNLQHA